MSHHALMEYVRVAKQAGASNEEITTKLVEAGWYTIDAQDALHLYARLTSAPELSAATPFGEAEREAQPEPEVPVQVPIITPAPTDPPVVALPVAELTATRRAVRPVQASSYDPMIIAIAALAFCVGFIGFILFAH